MVIGKPEKEELPQLKRLWEGAFGEHDGFWDLFLNTAFSAERCRRILEKGQITAALTWFDCTCRGQKMAYVYAVVTHPDFRGRGLCRALLADTQEYLARKGYSAVLLVPEQPGLRRMYEKLGYRTCTAVSEFFCFAGSEAAAIRSVDAEEYAVLRRKFLPEKGVVQEGENLTFLSAQAQLLAGADFLLAAYGEENALTGMELLGNREAAPGILKALGFQTGHFRCPGDGKAFAMVYPLTKNAVIPDYFGFAFD